MLTPYSQHQLSTAKQNDWQNLQDGEGHMVHDSTLTVDKPFEKYWKMLAFNHELSSKRIAIE
jgi:hypothetical protein